MQGMHTVPHDPHGNIERSYRSNAAIGRESPALAASGSNNGHQTAAKLQRLQQEINFYQEQVLKLALETTD